MFTRNVVGASTSYQSLRHPLTAGKLEQLILGLNFIAIHGFFCVDGSELAAR